MRTLRKSILLSAMAAALPFYMSDETAGAAPGEDPNAGASAADVSQESGTTQSATTATDESGTAGTAAAGEQGNGEAGADASTGATASAAASNSDAPVLSEVSGQDSAAALAGDTSSLATDANGTPIVPIAPAGDTVNVPVDSHAEAKERFAGLLAKLHQFEEEVADELREDLIAIGTLLHLHSKASTNAGATGDYKAGDLS
jgi:hypothetical protein